MYETRRNREAETRHHHWDNSGPWVKASTLDRDARINRPVHP